MDMTIAYSRIIDRRDRAIQLDLGEEKPVWFPLAKIVLDESAYTLTGPKELISQKQAEARGADPQYNPFGKNLVKLEEPEWQNEKAIGIDITVTRLTIGRPAVRKRVFFQKTKLESTGKGWSAPPLKLRERSDVLACSSPPFDREEVLPNENRKPYPSHPSYAGSYRRAEGVDHRTLSAGGLCC
jgi:hypothetical protein